MTEEIQIFENRQVRSIWDLVTIYNQLKLVFSTPKDGKRYKIDVAVKFISLYII